MGLRITYNDVTGMGQVKLNEEVIVKEWPLGHILAKIGEGFPSSPDYATKVTVSRVPFPDPDTTTQSHDLERTSDDGSMNLCVQFHDHETHKSVEEVTSEFNVWRKEWMESEECALLIAQLKERANPGVKNVVVMATGSLNGPTFYRRRKSAFQVGSALTVMETFGEPGKPLPCVIQDPCFSGIDKQILSSLGMKVVDDPDAFAHINANTLVVHVRGYDCLTRYVCEGIWPAAMITDEWSPPLATACPTACPSWCDMVTGMFEAYDQELPFEKKDKVNTLPNFTPTMFREHLAFKGACLFWRKSA